MQYEFDCVADAIASFQRVFFDPLRGNHGDTLIKMGSLKFLRVHGKVITDDPLSADAIVINGGAGMTEMWGGSAFLRLQSYIETGAKNIVVLPSTIHVSRDRLRELAKAAHRKGCNLVLFAREQPSFSRLKEAVADKLSVCLAHDMAFFLSPDDFGVANLRRPSRKQYALVVERRDAESSTNISQPEPSKVPLKHLTPLWLKRYVKRTKIRKLVQNTEFVKKCQQLALQEDIDFKKLVVGDVSIQSLYSFDDFVSYTAHADVIFTTRLHVAILSEILNKSCYLVPSGGEWKKNESVFEQSLALSANVRLLG